ncbi:MAG TPA: UDP-N-acetylmuramoyl-tripeptide--D-alanyl-D-alanine ligase [Ktedonobacteraceae bacterium]|jgi:UDP-N-acetylmuramoyl-tripeptide--D-alanyl-D-alanine ligase|nr:UDP-N-acetylmuramoyl-tripeptide--D-alanyl-D-alanine ligase [Ktedonobacteraceae bacterium]
MFTLNDVLQENQALIQSALTPPSEVVFRSAHHDSRQIGAGDLFVAIKGEHVDGHRFIATAARAGARGALCCEPVEDVPPDFIQIVVPDVVKALHATARVRARRQQGTTFLGITGSNGKTSTKEAVASVLSTHAPTLKTQASYNNEIGYPLTLLRLEPEHRYAVLEMGAQWVGELRWLSETIATPHWSMVTNVGTSHLEYFGSQERIVIAKTELVQVLSSEGIALLNYDDPNVRGMSEQTRAHVLFYGQEEGAAVRATDLGGDELFGRSFLLNYQGAKQPVQLQLPGEHGVTIALAAAAAGCAANMPLADIAVVLASLLPAKGRGEIKAGPNGSTLIDDSYNANRQSIVAITNAMHDTQRTKRTSGKRWAVVGDIFELGTYAHAEHYATGEALAGTLDYLVAVGEQARFFVEGAIAAGMPEQQAYYFSADVHNSAELEAVKRAVADLLKQAVHEHDLLLVKGSRGMRMETLLDLL